MKIFLFLLISTFAIGFAAGFYAYFTSSPDDLEFFDTEIGEEEIAREANEFEIIVDEYGGCALIDSCSSFRIIADGVYVYIPYGTTEERFSGSLTRKQTDSLKASVAKTDFAAVDATNFTGTCLAAVDGISYKYTIFEGDNSYFINSCEQNTKNIKLFEILVNYFELFSEEYNI